MEFEDIEKISEEGEKLYPISESCDKKCSELQSIDNWADLFYNFKTDKLKEKYIEILKESEYSQFFYALNYEYGINGFKKKLNKAFQIYQEAANSFNDTMCMYRLYHIYKNDYVKFGIPKRNRIYEKFYLFKCFSFLKYRIFKGYKYLCNRFSVLKEILIHFS